MNNILQELEVEKSVLRSKLDDSFFQLKSQEDIHEREKIVLMSKINLLEEKNYLLGSSISRKNQEKMFEDDLNRNKSPLARRKNDLNNSDFGSSMKREANRSIRIDDEYYILCSEIENVFKNIQESELKYTMHRRTQFPQEFS